VGRTLLSVAFDVPFEAAGPRAILDGDGVAKVIFAESNGYSLAFTGYAQ
jgi:hypothetical protein